MADPVSNAIAMLDGRSPDGARPTIPKRLTKLYKRVKGVQGPAATPVRKEGGSDGTPGTPGAEWFSPSILDQTTVLAEIFTQVYVTSTGRELTGFDLLVAIYQKTVEGK